MSEICCWHTPLKPKLVTEEFGHGLEKGRDWMIIDKLKLNSDKMEMLVMGPYSDLGNGCILTLDGVALPCKNQVHSLGIVLDTVQLLDKQVMAMVRSAFFQLVWLQ